MGDDDLDKRERAERGIRDLRAMLVEVLDVSSPVFPGIDAQKDAAAGLEGLDRAEAALEKWVERDVDGEWREEQRAKHAADSGECSGDDEDDNVLTLDRETARMVLARKHILDELPSSEEDYRSAADIADDIDRGEEYVREELERFRDWGIADLGEEGARVAVDAIVVDPLLD